MGTWEETAQKSATMVVGEATMAEVVEEVEAMTGTPIEEKEVAEVAEVAEEMAMRTRKPEDATTAIKLDTSRKTAGN